MQTQTLYYHPLASYCWKALIALYELDVPFEKRIVDLGNARDRAELSALWPLCKLPVLRTDERVVAESSTIVEYLDERHRGPHRLTPESADAARDVRFWDRVFDCYVMTPMQDIVLDRLMHANGDMTRAHATLETTYALVEAKLASSAWIAGDTFTMADCSAAPSLFYAATLRPFPEGCPQLRAYFERLVDRPSVRRTLDEAKPYFASYPFADDVPLRFR